MDFSYIKWLHFVQYKTEHIHMHIQDVNLCGALHTSHCSILYSLLYQILLVVAITLLTRYPPNCNSRSAVSGIVVIYFGENWQWKCSDLYWQINNLRCVHRMICPPLQQFRPICWLAVHMPWIDQKKVKLSAHDDSPGQLTLTNTNTFSKYNILDHLVLYQSNVIIKMDEERIKDTKKSILWNSMVNIVV